VIIVADGSSRANLIRSIAVYYGIAFGGSLAAGLVMRWTGLTVESAPALVAAAMWLPALGRLVANRTVDRRWSTPWPLRRWGRPRVFVLLGPLLIVAAVFALSYALAAAGGVAHWAPRWNSPARIALNLVIHLGLGLPMGAVFALGEELGWRGYLQPRLDSAGVRYSFVLVAVLWWMWHLPMIVFGGYLADPSPVFGQIRFLTLGILLSALFAWACDRAGSLWPAVWFHAVHNLLSQNLLPALFEGGHNPLWLGESGLLPLAGYTSAALIVQRFWRVPGRS
jgi:membrane protease YdiL (CAAX protease family)